MHLKLRGNLVSDKPLVLIDVDGVINAFADDAKNTWPDLRTTTAHADGREWKIRYSPTVVAWLNKLHERAEVTWLTTWETWAATSLAPEIGLEQGKDWVVFGRQADAPTPFSGPNRHTHWWKFELVKRAHAESDRRIVWVDDDFAFYSDAWKWAAARPNTLAIMPNCDLGITQKNMDELDAFLDAS